MLKVEKLSYARNGRILFKQLTFRLLPGQILHIVGANGSGKTTLLQILTGLRIPLTGSVMWNGISIEKNRVNFTENLLYVNHRLGMKSALTPIENLYLCLARRNLIDKQSKQKALQDIRQILEQLNLKNYANTLLTQLSVGQQRRLNLAKLLLIKADCWILDEPFTALDKEGIAFLSSIMEKQSARGGVIVFASHQMAYSSPAEIKTIFLDANHVR
ncbi:cytochrome c biogenesis heme-transporting ATPase CcmA [Rickettsiella endosymbiont of Miltochrista miniata]|uniref:cytochrome c biogenesis heme-transporting ATPase CcmA n=1 Tax=Rickettsiella endosymbiont of Miltochrista miniata TaxID=3066239 RepID=UPI00313E8998